jgi:DNA polymerase-3 subunit alpha
MTNFVHLHTHGEYSLLDGTGSADKYASVAKEKGFESLALTDHGNIDGVIKHQKACEKHGINPIVGSELYIVEDLTYRPSKGHKERRSHMTVLVKNQTGYENLMKMLTVANVEGYYRSPRVDPSLVLENYDGLVFMSACASTFLYKDWGKEMFLELNDLTEVFLEIMPHNIDIQRRTNELKLDFHKKYGIPMVATQDSHYPCPEDAKTQEVLLAIQRGASMLEKTEKEGGKRWAFDIDTLYLTTEAEIRKDFKRQGTVPIKIVDKAIEKTSDVADLCKDFRIKDSPVDLPTIPQAVNKDEFELLEDLVWDGFERRLPNLTTKELQTYEDRVNEELDLIDSLQFEKYFLIVWELIHWCRNNNILCGPGRGSVGGSLVAYLLEITDVDPIKYNLLFSRFINPDRIDLPDIDMDFEDRRREDIREHLEDLYGKYNVCGVSTFLTMGGRMALRDVARAFNVPLGEVDKAAKCIDNTIVESIEVFEEAEDFYDKYPDEVDIAINLEGQVRGAGQHAAAMCISKDDLREGKRAILALRKGTLVCNWDKYDCESQGLMKLDVLGLSTLTVLSECSDLIKENHGKEIVFNQLELDDKKIFKMISVGMTVGLFQLGSLGLQQYCKQLRPENFEDIVAATSLYRPGALRSGQAYVYVDRKNGDDWESGHKIIHEVTKDSYGIIIYQEQVMQLCNRLAGFEWEECDKVRKVMAKSQGGDLFAEFKQKFVEGCLEQRTLDEDQAEDLWEMLESFGSYGFNRSHAVQYSMMTYWTAWCKYHYPAEFMASLLTYGSQAEEMKQMYIEECRKMGLILELPKVGISDAYRWKTKDDKLYIPFAEIKGLGKASEAVASQANMHVRKGFFDQEVYYSGESKPNTAQMESLNRLKAFSPKPLTEKESESVNDLFKFDVSKDQMRAVRGIYDIIKDKFDIRTVGDWADSFDKGGEYFFFGRIIDINYSKKDGEIDSVFGYFKDEKGTVSVNFNKELYEERPDEILHCQNQWVLIGAKLGTQTSKLYVEEIFLQEDLTACDFAEAGNLELINKPKEPEQVNSNCGECKLGCGEAKPFSCGEDNIMVIFEKPPSNTVEQFFLDIFDDVANTTDGSRNLHITSVIKCPIPKGKSANNTQIKTCYNEWLKKEIEVVKPIGILAFGNTSLNALKGIDRGIMDHNGGTEWNRDFGCWICWGINPGMALYDSDMEDLLEDSIDNFVRCLENVGW